MTETTGPQHEEEVVKAEAIASLRDMPKLTTPPIEAPHQEAWAAEMLGSTMTILRVAPELRPLLANGLAAALLWARELHAEVVKLRRQIEGITGGETFVYLTPEDEAKAAAELSDEDLVKWVRWALAECAHIYPPGEPSDRGWMEAMAMHSVISLAKLVSDGGAERASFTVDGAQWPKAADGMSGDWVVTIERRAPIADVLPEGYCRLPDGVRCKCIREYRLSDGGYACCNSDCKSLDWAKGE